MSPSEEFKPERYPAYWLGVLPAAMVHAASEPEPSEAREILRRVLKDYLRSPVPSDAVRAYVREELRR